MFRVMKIRIVRTEEGRTGLGEQSLLPMFRVMKIRIVGTEEGRAFHCSSEGEARQMKKMRSHDAFFIPHDADA